MKALKIFLILLFCNDLIVTAASQDYPHISPESITASPGTSVTLTCAGSSPVKWKPFEEFEGFERVKTEVKIGDEDGPQKYSSKLTLSDVSYYDVGQFECNYEDDVNLERGSFSYLYVADPENLLVNHKGHSVVAPSIGLDYTFKTCKPTHPDVEVKLTLNQHPIDPNTDSSITYNPMEGYRIIQVVSKSAGYYTCTATKGKITQSFDVILYPRSEAPILAKPQINATLANAISVGENFILDCDMETEITSYFLLNWTKPESVINSGRATIALILVSPRGVKRYRTRLTVKDAQLSDGGEYECRVTSSGSTSFARHKMQVFGPQDGYLYANASDDGNITVNASGEAQWVIDAHGFPKPDDFSWQDPAGNPLTNKGRFTMELQLNKVILRIRDVTMEDGGEYTFVVRNGKEELTLDLFLTVRDSPKVSIPRTNNTMFLSVNKIRQFQCVAEGFPYPTIEWYFQKCQPGILDQAFGDCEDFELLESNGEERANVHENAPRRTYRNVMLNVIEFGNLKCVANNSVGVGVDEVSRMIIPVDFPDAQRDGFNVFGDNEPIETFDMEYICAVTKVNSTNNLKLYYTNTSQVGSPKIPLEGVKGVTVIESETSWSFQKKFTIKNIQTSHSGEYSCNVEHSNGEENHLEKSILLHVRELKEPEINDTNLNGTTITKKPGDKLETLYCRAYGVPTPNITWFKDDDIPFNNWPSREQIRLVGGELTLGFLKPEHSGTYKCRATNKGGEDERSTTIMVDEPVQLTGWLVGVAAIIIVGLIVALSIYIRRERKMKTWLKKLKLDEFENGGVDRINPEEGVEAQVNLLPYDKKYEFPRDRLTLGIRLGSGAFGLVLKGEAKGIKEGEASTTVAVKMVKPNADESHFKALMSELKIMIHLEQHVNVVNLLGACTKQLVKKRELLVIVEFCRYGSLLSYVHRHRRDFIDQLDPVRDVVDPNICYPRDSLCQSPNPSGTGNTARTSANGYRTMDQINMEEPSTQDFRRVHSGRGNRPEEYPHSSNVQSACTGTSFVSNSQMSDGKRRSSSSSGWNGNYHGVYNYRDVKPMTTSDLLCWSFQIARGMEYLASRKILHGDLAARNVLLADDNIVKICDFGLSREMCEEKYKKKSDGVPLPVKWMALEAIYFQVFSTQSDVWSFGVVMWELFTLGKTPYPGIEVDEHFYKMLNDGYRMEKPQYAPSSIYDLMESCWDIQPSGRPSFTALGELIGNLIEDGVRQHYIDLNAPYNSMNERRRMEGREDYLARMSGPDYNCASKRGTPDRTYANVVPPHVGSDDEDGIPNTLSVPHPSYGQTNGGNYQNLDSGDGNHDDSSPSLQRLANNTGYYYMNRDSNPTDSPGPTGIFSPRPNQSNPSQFTFSNPSPETDNTLNSPSPPKEIRGVSNMNYLPNNIFSPENSGREIQDIIEEASNNLSDLHHEDKDFRTRQKNDSGVSSLDSNFEGSKGSSPPLGYHNEATKPNNNPVNHAKTNSSSGNSTKSQKNNLLHPPHNNVPTLIPILTNGISE